MKFIPKKSLHLLLVMSLLALSWGNTCQEMLMSWNEPTMLEDHSCCAPSSQQATSSGSVLEQKESQCECEPGSLEVPIQKSLASLSPQPLFWVENPFTEVPIVSKNNRPLFQRGPPQLKTQNVQVQLQTFLI